MHQFFNYKNTKILQRKFKANIKVNSKVKVQQVYGVTFCSVSHDGELQKFIVDKSDSVIIFVFSSQLSMFEGINFKTLLILYKILKLNPCQK